jgi:hypothetical protein
VTDTIIRLRGSLMNLRLLIAGVAVLGLIIVAVVLASTLGGGGGGGGGGFGY